MRPARGQPLTLTLTLPLPLTLTLTLTLSRCDQREGNNRCAHTHAAAASVTAGEPRPEAVRAAQSALVAEWARPSPTARGEPAAALAPLFDLTSTCRVFARTKAALGGARAFVAHYPRMCAKGGSAQTLSGLRHWAGVFLASAAADAAEADELVAWMQDEHNRSLAAAPTRNEC